MKQQQQLALTEYIPIQPMYVIPALRYCNMTRRASGFRSVVSLLWPMHDSHSPIARIYRFLFIGFVNACASDIGLPDAL